MVGQKKFFLILIIATPFFQPFYAMQQAGSNAKNSTRCDPVQVYSNDLLQKIEDRVSKYTYPMNHSLFQSDEIQKYVAAINDYLWVSHLRITFETKKDQVTATLNLVEVSAEDSGKELITPFHRIEIPTGQEDLPENFKRKLIEKRLQQLKELALAYKNNQKNLDHAIQIYHPLPNFLYRTKSEIETDIANHVADTLALPLMKGIETLKDLTSTLSSQEQELITLIENINKEETFLKNWIAVKRSQKKLNQTTPSPENKNIQPLLEESFIRNFEIATQ